MLLALIEKHFNLLTVLLLLDASLVLLFTLIFTVITSSSWLGFAWEVITSPEAAEPGMSSGTTVWFLLWSCWGGAHPEILTYVLCLMTLDLRSSGVGLLLRGSWSVPFLSRGSFHHSHVSPEVRLLGSCHLPFPFLFGQDRWKRLSSLSSR